MDNRNRKLRRRLRVIAARAMLCVLVFSALGFTGYRSAAGRRGTSTRHAVMDPERTRGHDERRVRIEQRSAACIRPSAGSRLSLS